MAERATAGKILEVRANGAEIKNCVYNGDVVLTDISRTNSVSCSRFQPNNDFINAMPKNPSHIFMQIDGGTSQPKLECRAIYCLGCKY